MAASKVTIKAQLPLWRVFVFWAWVQLVATPLIALRLMSKGYAYNYGRGLSQWVSDGIKLKEMKK